MKKEILDERLKELGWSAYKLAQEVSKLRSQEEEQEKKVTSFVSSVRQALEKPDNSSLKTIETLIKALDGEIIIRWKERKEVVIGEREVKIE
ncbi:hypothetical protein [Synechocystis sp. PCC 7509]|jgi:SOS-response transcriptional repressor LexA|uniref:hypothetical protein n=1 Tax=Synechocystis sp. PCC 7509 TaxID=927677 RepID=UPI0002AC6FAA|nr:hypothetical protein [Synechocystis sp. PCC 7509]